MSRRNQVNLLSSGPFQGNLLGGEPLEEERNYFNSDEDADPIRGNVDDLVYRYGEVFPVSDLMRRGPAPPFVPYGSDQSGAVAATKNSQADVQEDSRRLSFARPGVMDLVARSMPTSEDIGARNQAALQTPAVPGYDPDIQQSFMPDHSPLGPAREMVAGFRDKYDALMKQFDGEGRREENVQELPSGVRVGTQDTSAWSKMTLGRDNDQAVLDIARAQLPGLAERKDRWGNTIVKLPDDAIRSVPRITGYTDDGFPVIEKQDLPIGGQEFYLNRPGFSKRDAINGIVDASPRLAGMAVGSGMGLVSDNPYYAAAAVGATTAGANMLLDKWAQAAGSKQPIDFERAAEQGHNKLIGRLSWLPKPWRP